MADESCVFPGDPRAPGHWLDRDTAERLLRGESLEAVPRTGLDEHADAEAGVLAKALHTLAAESGPSPAELPGEAAALAAFQRAHGAARPGAEGVVATGERRSAEAGPVLLGAARGGGGAADLRWGRPIRFGLAAALAGCMIGGVAVAAGTGVLPSPFGRTHEPAPAASVSEAATPDKPLMSPSPGPSDSGVSASPSAEDSTHGSGGAPSHEEKTGSGAVADPKAGTGKDRGAHKAENWWAHVVKACRDYRGGKPLDGERRRSLTEAARGAERVKRFCDSVLAKEDGTGGAHHYRDVTGGGDDDANSGNTGGEPTGTDPTDEGSSSSDGGGNSLQGGGAGSSSDPSTLSGNAAPESSTAAETPAETPGVTFSDTPAQ